MKTFTSEEQSDGPNLTPVIDVVFLLLIFFLVATRFDQEERELDTRLPQVVQARPLTSGQRQIIVNIGEKGDFKVAGKTLTAKQMETLLSEEAGKNPNMQSVQIRADERVPFKYPALVMGICEREKIKHSCAVQQRGGLGDPAP
jgi:biopolymer transport protein ExbD